MEYVWKPRKTVELSSLVRCRANVSNDLYVAKEENEKYMRTSIDEIERLNSLLIGALKKLETYRLTWQTPNPMFTKNNAMYTRWIQSIKSNYTVDINDIDDYKIKLWVKEYAKLQMNIDKLFYRIYVKINSVNKSYEIQERFIKPIISVCEPDEIFLEPIRGTITPTQFTDLKAEMQTISRNHIESAILLLMSSNDIVRIFLKKKLTLIDFVDEVKTCIEGEEPFGNIASSDLIYDRDVIVKCINTIKKKHRINETTSNPSIRINQQENMENVDAMFDEFNIIISQPHIKDFLNLEYGFLSGKGKFNEERLAYIADKVAEDMKKENMKKEKQETIIPVLAEISDAQANAKPYEKGHSRYSFYEFAPDVTDDNDNEFLTGIIVITANAALSLSQAQTQVKQQLYDGFNYARDTLFRLCSSVGNTCGSYITSVSNVMSRLFSSAATAATTATATAATSRYMSEQPFAASDGGGAAAPTDENQSPPIRDSRAGIGFRRRSLYIDGMRKQNSHGKNYERLRNKRAIPSASTSASAFPYVMSNTSTSAFPYVTPNTFPGITPNTFPNMMPSASTRTMEEIDTRPEKNIYAPIRQPNIAENTENTRMEDLARATQIDRELQSRRGKTIKEREKEKLDGGKSTRKLISKNRKYSRRK